MFTVPAFRARISIHLEMSATSSNGDIPSEVEADGSTTNRSQKSSQPDESLLSLSSVSEETSSLVCEQEQTATSLSRKRRLVTSTGRKLKRMKVTYNDQYRGLLNEVTHTAVAGIIFDNEELGPPSYHGLSYWTSDEKAIFFNVLARKGRDAIHAISSAIGTKSEMEVRVYLGLLRKASVETNLLGSVRQRLAVTDIPSAVEIGPECCLTLDQHAQSLSLLQQNHEETVERKNHADLWLLTRDVGLWAQELLDDGEDGEVEVLRRLPAAGLLDLPVWLELSERVFMNGASPGAGGNWQGIAEEEETPSIMTTAFSDFHRLAISITKRLIQASLFYAMSRLRATDSGQYRYQPVVRSKDVRTAVHVLGMTPNADEFWKRAARRCGLNVFHGRCRQIRSGKLKPLPYDEVERLLDRSDFEKFEAGTLDAPLSSSDVDMTMGKDDDESEPLAADGSSSGDEDEADFFRSSDLSNNSGSSDSPSEEDEVHPYQKQTSTQRRAQREREQDQAEYVEAFDQSASLVEEQELWQMLGETSTEGAKVEDVELPKKPRLERKGKDDFLDWRDRTEYWSEWETLETPVPNDRFLPIPKRDCLRDTEQRHGCDTTDNHEGHASDNKNTTKRKVRLANDENPGVADSRTKKPGDPGDDQTLTENTVKGLGSSDTGSEDEESDADTLDSNSECTDSLSDGGEHPPGSEHGQHENVKVGGGTMKAIQAQGLEEDSVLDEVLNSTSESEGLQPSRSFGSS